MSAGRETTGLEASWETLDLPCVCLGHESSGHRVASLSLAGPHASEVVAHLSTAQQVDQGVVSDDSGVVADLRASTAARGALHAT